MKNIYLRIKNRARQVVLSFPAQRFYENHENEHTLSRRIFETDPVINRLHEFVSENMGDNVGHGMNHVTKVTLDAGSLMYIEGESLNYPKNYIDSRVRLAQCSGLLHDIKRGQKNHAVKGAEFAKDILKDYREVSPEDITDIYNAIYNHEAFKTNLKTGTPEGDLVSDCLYDADKFRWGPDNFSHMVWDMLECSRTPLSRFIHLYPEGIKALKKIKTSFRTPTGKKYGPSFIDTVLAIGDRLYDIIKTEFAEYL